MSNPGNTSGKPWPELLLFTAMLIMAGLLGWEARDLLWSLWSSSLVIGYTTLLLGAAGGMIRGQFLSSRGNAETAGGQGEAASGIVLLIPVIFLFGFSPVSLVFALLAALSLFSVFADRTRQNSGRRTSSLLHFLAVFPAGVFFIAFFSVHFGGFHLVHAVFLNSFFPLLPESLEAFQPAGLLFFFRDLIRLSLIDYWPFILASACSARPMLKSAWRGENPNFMLSPYKNVIRMHLMIFVIAICQGLGAPRIVLYITLAVYFLPNPFSKKQVETVVIPGNVTASSGSEVK